MKQNEMERKEQLSLFKEEPIKIKPAKRINIVSLKLVRESSILYKEKRISSPEAAYKLLKEFLVESDRERFVVVCLDTKNQPVAINICNVGCPNASIVHPCW